MDGVPAVCLSCGQCSFETLLCENCALALSSRSVDMVAFQFNAISFQDHLSKQSKPHPEVARSPICCSLVSNSGCTTWHVLCLVPSRVPASSLIFVPQWTNCKATWNAARAAGSFNPQRVEYRAIHNSNANCLDLETKAIDGQQGLYCWRKKLHRARWPAVSKVI